MDLLGSGFLPHFHSKAGMIGLIHRRYIAILPMVNERVESFLVHLPWIQNRLFSVYEMGYVPESSFALSVPL